MAVSAAAGACSSGGDSPAGTSATTAGTVIDNALKLCADLKPSMAATTATQVFSPGQKAERTLTEHLGMSRDQAAVPSALAERGTDGATTSTAMRAIHNQLLDGPAWTQATAVEVGAPATSACARAEAQVLAGVFTALDARNVSSAAAPAQGDHEPPLDLGANLDIEAPLLAAARKVMAVDTPWPNRPASAQPVEADAWARSLADVIDMPTQRMIAAVIAGMSYAEESRLAAVKPWYQEIDHADLATIMTNGAISVARARSFDLSVVTRAGIGLASAAERLAAHLAENPVPATIDSSIQTPLGEIVIRGASADDVWELAAPALLIDQGGSDSYRGESASPANESIPLSVLIDVSGDDRYIADTGGSQGAGVLSFGFLVDWAGNDDYQAGAYGQGSGVLGVGGLLDVAGDDRYQARSNAQGAGAFGLGAAVDLAGNDMWRLTSQGQGFAGVRGAGALVDAGGNDLYEADDTNITNPSPQQADHNTSLAQGAATGLRNDGGPNALSGGTGLLVDLGGDDRYSCGLFCQGAGYWFAHGILADRSGSDTYRGVRYVQGASAHFALGTLIDDAGNDAYEAVTKMAQGAGHDGAAGYFLEGEGNDRYSVTGLSHGASNNLGYGFFVDATGDDTYGTSAGEPGEAGWFGQASADRFFTDTGPYAGAPAIALFFDLAGADDYRLGPPEAGNGAMWKLPGAGTSPPNHRGVGEDVG